MNERAWWIRYWGREFQAVEIASIKTLKINVLIDQRIRMHKARVEGLEMDEQGKKSEIRQVASTHSSLQAVVKAFLLHSS